MQIVAVGPSLATKPPPLWFVTNGDVTVGPVSTTLLLQGVLHERVPAECLVRERTWRSWRKLDRIREVAALRRAQARGGEVRVERALWRTPAEEPHTFEDLAWDLARAPDPSEALRRCLVQTMQATGAWVGAVHRRRPPASGFVTTCVQGPGLSRHLGTVLSYDDPSIALALHGETLCEVPRPGLASGVVQERLGMFPACSGVAAAPIVCFGRLYAVMELGRPDHTFRDTDFRRIVSAVSLVAERLSTIQNPPSVTLS